MKKINGEGIKSDKGFTMIELIIVIAILGILAAILVPSFTQMTRKSRLKADISTVRQVQTQMDLYVAEHDGKYPGTVNNVEPTDKATMELAVIELVKGQYLKASDVKTKDGGDIDFQSTGVEIGYDTTNHHAIITVPTELSELAHTLGDRDKEWMSYTEPTGSK